MVFTIAAVSRINLLTNPNAEDGIGSPSGDDVETIPGWTTTSNFTVVQYDAPTFPTVAESKRISGGKNFFAGGPNNDMSTATQVVDVSSSASAIDAGQRIAQLEAQLAGYDGQGDNAAVRAEFLSSSGTVLGWMQVGPVSATDDVFQLKTASGLVPAGTRSIRVTMISIRIDGNYNDGYFDNLYLGLAPKQ
jgi:hypothetical protein